MTQIEIRRVRDVCGMPCVDVVTAAALHRECFCLAVDPAAVRKQLNEILAAQGVAIPLDDVHANLFAALPVFVPEQTMQQMASVVAALDGVVSDPTFMDAALAWAPPIARIDPGSPGGLLGFDFHLGPDGPRLIEINTNPGGLLLNSMLARAQRLCLPSLSVPASADDADTAAVDILLDEWRAQSGQCNDGLVAIVDEAPEQQYLYAEFILFQQALQARGHGTVICDPADLAYVDDALWLGDKRIGFAYNRLTDFALEAAPAQALRQAYLKGVVAVSPHPRAHALWADKRNMSLLSDRNFLAKTRLPRDLQALLSEVVPHTVLVTAANREELWRTRRQWFFKPAAGFGSRASYRGDKLTHKTWAHMAGRDYVAQAIVPPSERHMGSGEAPLKVDLRCYAYQGRAIFFAARLYQGQTTNFRTPGGGFAPVLTLTET